MSTPNLTINTILPLNNITSITIDETNNTIISNNNNDDDRSPLQSPRAKSPISVCPNAPKKIVIPVPRTPRIQNEDVCKQLFN
jgi:hypothetical protein